jgi:hypothetical protein
MGQLAEALRALITNSDDLSSLPQLVARVEQLEADEGNYQERIAKLQDINKSYLAQIPIPNQQQQQEDEEEKEPTLEDAKEYLVAILTGEDE